MVNPNPLKSMAFDQNQSGPVVEPAKKTTQVNLWMALAVIIFFLCGGLAIRWFHRHPREITHDVNQQMRRETPPPDRGDQH